MLVINALILFDLLLVVRKDNYKIKKSLLVLSFYIVSVFLFNSGVIGLYEIFVGCYVLKDVSLTRLIGYKLFIELACILILAIGIATGTIENSVRDIGYKGLGYGYTFGFPNTNVSSYLGLGVILCLYYFGIKWNSFVVYILGIIFAGIVFYYTGGRTYFFSEAALFLLGICSYSKRMMRTLRPFLTTGPLIIAALLVVIVIITMNPKMSETRALINTFVSWRLGYYAITLNAFSVKNIFFGLPGGASSLEIPIDNSYLGLILAGGIGALAILFYYCFNFMKPECVLKNRKMIPIVIAFLLAGLVESSFGYFNATGLVFWVIVYKGTHTSLWARR